MALPIEKYALLSDGETTALVGIDGSIDWLCWPDFSSPACFAALLGTPRNGRWLLAPREKPTKVTRRYRDHTLILETVFETSAGTLSLTDFMPRRERHSDVVRIAHCRRGKVTVRMELCLRFDWGRTVPWTGPREGSSWTAAGGTGVAYLRTREPLQTIDSTAHAQFTLRAGETRTFALTYADAREAPPQPINIKTALKQTEEFWLRWTGANRYDGPWKDAIERSLITLKALIYQPTGGIVAAPTTSLPERIGDSLNWDYRFCWLRDAAFTLESLLACGYHQEAMAWREWLLQSTGSDVREMQIVYGVRGERHLPEYELPWLRGYRNSSPVRVGNLASQQSQLDVYGEVADALTSMSRAGMLGNERVARFRREITERAAAIHHLPTSGIWEQRRMQEHFTYSKMMAWVALDRGVRAIEHKEIDGPLRAWKRTRDQMHRHICKHGFNPRVGGFVRSAGSAKFDASSLLLPVFGFLPFADERVQSTLRMIEKTLVFNGLVIRHLPSAGHDREFAFVACSFWLVHNLAMSGRRSEAEKLYDKLLALRNDVGLLSEEYDSETGRFLGNFPQALSHIALINAGRALSEPTPGKV